MMPSLHKCLLLYLLTCPGLHALGSEIIHGKKVPDKLMLYMASVQNKAGKHVCGGFLINEDFVLTAAHCNMSAPTSVVLGTHNLKKVNVTMRFTVKTCQHPSYESVRTGNDIMLLKLSKKAPLSKRLQPVKLPKSAIKIKDKKKCQVAGWGLTKTKGKAVDALQGVKVSTVNQKICKQEWSNALNLPPKVICAGGFGTDKGFCQGDSGGPLVCDGKAVGIVSFNYRGNCDYPNRPNVYTEISQYLPWIKEALEKKSC